jgi:PAS domain S-box-containing protein
MNKEFSENQLLSALFSHSSEGIIIAASGGEIILINPSAEKMFGYGSGELVGQKIEVLLPTKMQHAHVHHRQTFHEKPVSRSMGSGRDLFAMRKDGTTFPVEISLSHYELLGTSYAIAFVIDITVRKHSEHVLQMQKDELKRVSDEIMKLNAGLEQKVADRTMMLRETLVQLEQSKTDLAEALEKEKELSDLKSRFVSTVSHEFRTPLAAVLSSASLLAKYTKEEEQEKRERHINRIKESIKHLNDMLGDLLSLGKLEEGLIEAKRETFNCEEFMGDFISEMTNIAKPQQKIVFDHSGGLVVNTDKRIIRNILLNLVSNAIKFSADDGVIQITCDNGSDYLTLAVKDTGIGISEEDLQHMFERFFRARNAQNIQGTGLGLHIVSKYVELLHGKISLDSELNKGTTFTVIVPNA